MSQQDIPQAVQRPIRRGISPIWIVPVAALVAGLWLVYKAVAERGPNIRIQFENAEGIEAGKTRLKYLSVDLGVVTSVRFASEGNGVEVEVELAPGSESRLTETTRFWLVKPRLDATGVSGLGTLFSGVYIGMDPGEGGAALRTFQALADPPRILSHQHGSVYRLLARDLGSLAIGSPLYFRRIQVGSVVGYALTEDHANVMIEVFVESPHDKHVDQDSRFWNVSGVQVEAGSEGLKVDMASLAALAAGGLAFDTPEGPGAGGEVAEDHVFPLYPSRNASLQQEVVGTYPFLVYFDDSIRGLNADAAVEFRGIRVGSVRDILPARSHGNNEVRIGVLLGIDPQRLPFPTESELRTGWQRRLEWVGRLAEAGARAQLKTGNLLTGQKYVDIDLYPHAPDAEVAMDELGYPVIPSMPGALSGITDSLASILSEVESLPIASIGRDVGDAAAGLNAMINSQDLQATIQNMSEATARLNTVLEHSAAASGGLEELMQSATAAVGRLEATLASVEQATSEDGVIGHEALQTLRELGAAARSFRAMAEYLERHPEALISGKPEAAE